MLSEREVINTLNMLRNEHLDVRTVTLGVSLFDCVSHDIDLFTGTVKAKLRRYASQLVNVCNEVGDKFGIPKGENVMGKLVNALHRLGFHEVYDTTYGADLTVIEEAEELLERISSGAKGPLFPSCCPAWVKFCDNLRNVKKMDKYGTKNSRFSNVLMV